MLYIYTLIYVALSLLGNMKSPDNRRDDFDIFESNQIRSHIYTICVSYVDEEQKELHDPIKGYKLTYKRKIVPRDKGRRNIHYLIENLQEKN